MSFDDLMELVVEGFEAAGVSVTRWDQWRQPSELCSPTGNRAGRRRTKRLAATWDARSFWVSSSSSLLTSYDDHRRPDAGKRTDLGSDRSGPDVLSFSLEVELEGSLPWKRSIPDRP